MPSLLHGPPPLLPHRPIRRSRPRHPVVPRRGDTARSGIREASASDLDDPRKIDRLKQWCTDANALQKEVRYYVLYVQQEQFERYRPGTFTDLVKISQ